MKYLAYLIFVFSLTLNATPLWATTAGTVSNIQEYGGGARFLGLGRSSLALVGDPNGIYANPAYLATITDFSAGYMAGLLLSDFEYVEASAATAFGPGTVGLAYIQQVVGDIPETIFNGGEIYQVSSYRAGDRVYLGSYAVSLFRHALPHIQAINLGTNLKFYQQFAGTTVKSGIGLDVGAQADLKLPSGGVLSGMSGGLAYINLMAPKLVGGSGLENTVQSGLRMSLAWKFLRDHLLTSFDIYNASLHWGTEYTPFDGFCLRAGQDDGLYVVGLGLSVDDVSGVFQSSPMNFSFDYTYKFMNAAALSSDLSHFFSLTLRSQGDRSRLALSFSSADRFVNEPAVQINGQTQRFNRVEVYNNGLAIANIKANEYGNFEVKLNLDKGDNQIFYQCYETEQDLFSERSQMMRVVLDSEPPKFKFNYKQRSDELLVILEGSENLQSGVLKMKDTATLISLERLTDAKILLAHIPLHDADQQFDFVAQVTDKAGNVSSEEAATYRVVRLAPADGTVVYRMPVTVSGILPAEVQTAILNNGKIFFDETGHFSSVVDYKAYGKYALTLETINRTGRSTEVINTIYYEPIFKDLLDHPLKDDFQHMAALGFYPVDSSLLFNPQQLLLRADAILWLAKAEDVAPNPKRQAPFLDIETNHPLYPYLSALVDEGWLGTGPQTKLNPTAIMTRAQAIELLVRASWNAPDPQLQVPFADVPANSTLSGFVAKALKLGIIDPAEKLYPNAELKKADYLRMMGRLPEIKKRLSRISQP